MKKMKNKDSGMTLVELLISFIISILLLLTAIILIVHAYRTWYEGEEKVGLVREADHAVYQMEWVTRMGGSSGWDEDEEPDKFKVYTGTITLGSFWKEDGTVKAEVRGGSERNLTYSDVKKFEINKKDPPFHREVGIILELERNGEVHLSSTTAQHRVQL